MKHKLTQLKGEMDKKIVAGDFNTSLSVTDRTNNRK